MFRSGQTPHIVAWETETQTGEFMRHASLLLLILALALPSGGALWAQSRPNNATPELNRDQDDNVPDVIQYIVQQRTQWDFGVGSPESRAFTQLLNFGDRPCFVLEGRIIPSLVGDGFEAECRCRDGSVRLLDYDEKRVFTERMYIDHRPYELPEIYVKKPEDEVLTVLKTTK